MTLGMVGLAWATNPTWTNIQTTGAVTNYAPSGWTNSFDNVEEYVGPASLALRDDGYGLNYVGYTDLLNNWIAEAGLGDAIKVLINGERSGLFRVSGAALVPGFRMRLVVQERCDFLDFLYVTYVFEYLAFSDHIEINDCFFEQEADSQTEVQNFLTHPTQSGLGDINGIVQNKSHGL